MEDISRQLLYQRLRNRVIDLLQDHSALESIASLGAFEMINQVEDVLPLDYSASPDVFSEEETDVVTEFLRLAAIASDATSKDTCDVAWFRKSDAWVNLSSFSGHALSVFSQRGRFSEEQEETFSRLA